MTKTNWGGHTPALTLDQYRKILKVKAIRNSVPTYSDLAKEFGVAHHAVLTAVSAGIKRYDYVLYNAVPSDTGET
jgi:predicted metal-dependent phosphoesterase TrpH